MTPNEDVISSETLPDNMNAQMTQVLAYWQDKCTTAPGGLFPTLSDLNLIDLYKIAGNLVICDVVQQDQVRYRWRYWGSALTNYFNIEMTGKFIDEAYSETSVPQIIACYDWIVDNRCCHYWQRKGDIANDENTQLTLDNETTYKTFERLFCPIIDEAGNISQFFGIITFNQTAEQNPPGFGANVKGDIFQSG